MTKRTPLVNMMFNHVDIKKYNECLYNMQKGLESIVARRRIQHAQELKKEKIAMLKAGCDIQTCQKRLESISQGKSDIDEKLIMKEFQTWMFIFIKNLNGIDKNVLKQHMKNVKIREYHRIVDIINKLDSAKIFGEESETDTTTQDHDAILSKEFSEPIDGGPYKNKPPKKTQLVTVMCGPDKPSKEFLETKEMFFPSFNKRLKSRSTDEHFDTRKDFTKIYHEMISPFEEKLYRVVNTIIERMRWFESHVENEEMAIQSYQDSPNYDHNIMTLEPYVAEINRLANKNPSFNKRFKDEHERKRFDTSLVFRLFDYTGEKRLPKLPTRRISNDVEDLEHLLERDEESPEGIITFKSNDEQIRYKLDIPTTKEEMIPVCKLYHDSDVEGVSVVSINKDFDDKGARITETPTNYNLNNVLVLVKSHSEGRDVMYREAGKDGSYWIMKRSVSTTQLEEIEKDFKFIKMIGLLHRIAIPQCGRELSYNEKTEGITTKSVLLFRVGNIPELKTPEPKYLNDNGMFRQFCGSMTLLLSCMGYRNGRLKFNEEGKIVYSGMNGNKKSTKQSIPSNLMSLYLSTKRGMNIYQICLFELIVVCSSARKIKNVNDLFTDLRLESSKFRMEEPVNTIYDEVLSYFTLSSKPVKIYGVDGYMLSRRKSI